MSELVEQAEGSGPNRQPTSARHRARLGPVRRTVREVGLAFITLGVIVLLFVAHQLLGTNLIEARHQSALAEQFNAQIARHRAGANSGSAPANAEPSPPPGDVVARLVIPRIGVDKFVVAGVGRDDLQRGPGHYPGTALPGENGNSAIAGHRTTYGAPFFRLDELTTGDPIKVTDIQGRTWEYQVSGPSKVVRPNDISVLDDTPFPQLTLTTCNPRFSASTRLIVFARLVGPPASGTPSSAQVPGAPDNLHRVPAAVDNLGHGDSRGLAPALLYGALVLVLWVGVRIWINRTRGWHRLAAYVIGIAVCLVPLWFCFQNVARLLPQNI